MAGCCPSACENSSTRHAVAQHFDLAFLNAIFLRFVTDDLANCISSTIHSLGLNCLREWLLQTVNGISIWKYLGKKSKLVAYEHNEYFQTTPRRVGQPSVTDFGRHRPLIPSALVRFSYSPFSPVSFSSSPSLSFSLSVRSFFVACTSLKPVDWHKIPWSRHLWPD